MRMPHLAATLLALVAISSFAHQAPAADFPFSEPDFDWLSQGGGSPQHLWTAGDFWAQEFQNTGLPAVNELGLHLVIEDDDALAFDNLSFDVFVNGNDVGDFTLLANTAGLYEFQYAFPAIAGDDYQIQLIANSTIGDGDGSFSLLVDGRSSYASLTAVPEPATLGLGLLALVSLTAVAKRRARG